MMWRAFLILSTAVMAVDVKAALKEYSDSSCSNHVHTYMVEYRNNTTCAEYLADVIESCWEDSYGLWYYSSGGCDAYVINVCFQSTYMSLNALIGSLYYECVEITDPPTAIPTEATCDDDLQNGDETGVDCGGSCTACPLDCSTYNCSAWNANYTEVENSETFDCAAYPCDASDLDTCCEIKALCFTISGGVDCLTGDVLISNANSTYCALAECVTDDRDICCVEADPTPVPTADPTADPTPDPTADPTSLPTMAPTFAPTGTPTTTQSSTPTLTPTSKPTTIPTTMPTTIPTTHPITPTTDPTQVSTPGPTGVPTTSQTFHPSNMPTPNPTTSPASSPTSCPISDTTTVGDATTTTTTSSTSSISTTATTSITTIITTTIITTNIPTKTPTSDCKPTYTWDYVRAELLCPSTNDYGSANKTYAGAYTCTDSTSSALQANLEVSLANGFYKQCDSWCVYDYDTIINNVLTGADEYGGFIWKNNDGCWQWVTAGFCFTSAIGELKEVSVYAVEQCDAQYS